MLWRATVDRVLIRRRGDDDTIELAGSGVSLWLALAEPTTRIDLVERLAHGHGIDREIVESDIGPVVAELIARGALVER